MERPEISREGHCLLAQSISNEHSFGETSDEQKYLPLRIEGQPVANLGIASFVTNNMKYVLLS